MLKLTLHKKRLILRKTSVTQQSDMNNMINYNNVFKKKLYYGSLYVIRLLI